MLEIVLITAVVLLLCALLIAVPVHFFGWRNTLWCALGSAVVLVLSIALVAGGVLLLLAVIPVEITEMNDPADYLRITGNHNNDRPAAFIATFFPDELGADFTDVTYHYKAEKFDSIACETYLEFTLPGEAFAMHVSALARHGAPQPFPFADGWDMWIIDNHLDTWKRGERGQPDKDNDNARNIESARVGLILCNQAERRLVYFALMVHDGGASNTDTFSFFLTRFGIDPLAFDRMLVE